MYRFLSLGVLVVIFAGCSNFKITAQICDNISTQQGAVIPTECKVYLEEKAKKAFDKVVDDKKVSDKDIIEYKKSK